MPGISGGDSVEDDDPPGSSGSHSKRTRVHDVAGGRDSQLILFSPPRRLDSAGSYGRRGRLAETLLKSTTYGVQLRRNDI